MAFAFTNLINNSFFGFFCGPPVHNRVEEREREKEIERERERERERETLLQTAEIVCFREHVSIPICYLTYLLELWSLNYNIGFDIDKMVHP